MMATGTKITNVCANTMKLRQTTRRTWIENAPFDCLMIPALAVNAVQHSLALEEMKPQTMKPTQRNGRYSLSSVWNTRP